MAAAEAVDRDVIGRPVSRHEPARHILHTAPLDHARGAHSDGVVVEHQRDHHRRIVRRPAAAIGAIGPIERRQIKPLDDLDHKPRQMPLRQPLRHAGRQQHRLLAIAGQEVLRHHRILVPRPDRPETYATAS
jgi:hypothetical protein